MSASASPPQRPNLLPQSSHHFTACLQSAATLATARQVIYPYHGTWPCLSSDCDSNAFIYFVLDVLEMMFYVHILIDQSLVFDVLGKVLSIGNFRFYMTFLHALYE